MLTQTWRIEMLGGLRARRGAQQVTRFRSGTTGALLAHLAYHSEILHSRVALAGLLWPDAESSDALASLRTALGSLRHQLEPPGVVTGSVLAADREHIQLLPESFTTDIIEFESLLLAARQAQEGRQSIALLIQAHALYRGDLLPGIDPKLEEAWADMERDRLRQAFYESLLALSNLVHTQGDGNAAIAIAQRALKVDAQQEDAHECLMRFYAAQGRPDAAARQYKKLETILRDTLQITPSPFVREVYQDIKRYPEKYVEKFVRSHYAPISTLTAFPSSTARPFISDAFSSDSFSSDSLTPPLAEFVLPLPTCRTHFYGRQRELQQILHLLKPADTGEQADEDTAIQDHSVRLLTLTGHGGTGKTRLALEAASRLKDAYEGHVIFVPLTDLPDGEGIAEVILGALCALRTVSCEPLEQAVAVLGKRPALLALDNFEHLLPTENDTPQTPSNAAAEFVDALLERAPNLKCLVTSRHRLELSGEREIVVRPLPIPDVSVMPERLLTYPSIKLFIDRAQLANPDFRFHSGNSMAIQTLCQHLEGIPLAIELAAAWARTLSPAQMLTKLDSRLNFLRRDKGPWPSRHLSLRAALDGSYRMLPTDVKRFFVRLSAFRGGWTLAAAQAVAAAEFTEEAERSAPSVPFEHTEHAAEHKMEEALACLEALSHHSLLQAEEESGEMRFFLLETLRAYCEEQLSPSEHDHLSRRHADWFMKMAEEADANLVGAEQKVWLDRLAREQENIRAALAWGLCDPASRLTGLRLAGALPWFWDVRCHLSEGRRWLAQFLAVTQEAQIEHGVTEDTAEAEKGLAWARARALSGAGWLALRQDDNTGGRALYAECLLIRQQLKDSRGIAFALNGLGLAARQQGDFQATYEFFKQALVLRQALGDARTIASSLNNLAIAAGELGRDDEARDLYTQSLALARAQDNAWGIANALSNLGEVLTRCGEYREASLLFAQSLPIKQHLSDGDGIAGTLEAIAYMQAKQGQQTDATRLLAASEALRIDIASPLFATSRQRQERIVMHLRTALGETAFVFAWEEGRALNREQAVALALKTLLP